MAAIDDLVGVRVEGREGDETQRYRREIVRLVNELVAVTEEGIRLVERGHELVS